MIYATPFRQSDKQATAPSQDAGLSTLSEARTVYGEPSIEGPALLIYLDGDDSLLLSRIPFCVDAAGNNG